MPMRRIAELVHLSVATVSRVLARLGLSSLGALAPKQPVVRYERQTPGELLHMDTKKLARNVRPGHRVTGDLRDTVVGAGWEVAHVAIDDHSRVGFVQMYADETKLSAVAFLGGCRGALRGAWRAHQALDYGQRLCLPFTAVCAHL